MRVRGRARLGGRSACGGTLGRERDVLSRAAVARPAPGRLGARAHIGKRRVLDAAERRPHARADPGRCGARGQRVGRVAGVCDLGLRVSGVGHGPASHPQHEPRVGAAGRCGRDESHGVRPSAHRAASAHGAAHVQHQERCTGSVHGVRRDDSPRDARSPQRRRRLSLRRRRGWRAARGSLWRRGAPARQAPRAADGRRDRARGACDVPDRGSGDGCPRADRSRDGRPREHDRRRCRVHADRARCCERRDGTRVRTARVGAGGGDLGRRDRGRARCRLGRHAPRSQAVA